MRYAVIMAGGAGKRLWPFSRIRRPKQLLPLLNGKSLLEIAVERLTGLFDNDRIYVITNAEYADQIARALGQLPRQHIIGEPQGRDTANAIALGTALLSALDEQATMAVFTADHVIRPTEKLAEAVNVACRAAQEHPDALLTFGVHPTWPHTGLGYIHCGKRINGVHEVQEFKEKPDHHTARQYTESGQHFWNSGMFVWQVGAIRRALEEFLPDSIAKLLPIGRAASEGKDLAAMLAEVYPTLEKISIDYAVMEKAHKVLMVELQCEWLDVGDWPALENVADLDEADNIVLAKNCVVLDSMRNVLVAENDHLLAVLGMDECIVVHTQDATLVCDKSDSQRLKELVALVQQMYGDEYV